MEILSHIFLLACTDGGSTGCALSMVSKYIRETSKPHKYHSVALHGQRQTKAFASVLAHTQSHHRRVVHLFLSNNDANPSDPKASTMDKRVATSAGSIGRKIASSLKDIALRLPGAETQRRKSHLCNDESNIDAAIDILDFVATSLQTLAICFVSPWMMLWFRHRNALREPTVLPALRELTLAYRAPHGLGFLHSILGNDMSLFPSLRCLDISRVHLSPGEHVANYRIIKQAITSLEYLAIPSEMTLFMGQDLDMVLPPSITTLFVFLHDTPSCCFCRNPETPLVENGICRHINIKRSIPSGGPIVYRAYLNENSITPMRVRMVDQWKARICGKLGLWDDHRAVTVVEGRAIFGVAEQHGANGTGIGS